MSETDLFDLVDCVPTPVFVLHVRPDGPPVYAHYNAEALRRLRRPLSDFVGRSTSEAFGEEYGLAAEREQMQTIAEGKQRRYEFELPFGEEIRMVRTTLCPQYDKQGNLLRLIGHSEDVSSEWIANATQAKLQSIGSEVEQFVNMAAHDLRTPMRNVAMLTEMLRENFADMGDGKLRILDLLDKTANKAMTLISDVLAHANAVSHSDRSSLFDLADLVGDIHSILDPQHSHRVECSPLSLTAERTIFQIVLRNLIENAFKHGKSDNLHLCCRAVQAEGNMIEISLSDDGAGFTDPGIAFLETGDFRVDSGYGLLGVRRLIRARGGRISASNNHDSPGSTVCFTLPGSTLSAREGVIELPRARNHPTTGRHLDRRGA
ncbi:ATP-binding protein [Sulfitobacter sp. HNIBRBA3233]|uniref:PAS domain-containing sensor histidine kinase n=1 Tax=Sulfitobacter marinivivus TaxID=3158558 RepID=UPI0032DE75BA